MYSGSDTGELEAFGVCGSSSKDSRADEKEVSDLADWGIVSGTSPGPTSNIHWTPASLYLDPEIGAVGSSGSKKGLEISRATLIITSNFLASSRVGW